MQETKNLTELLWTPKNWQFTNFSKLSFRSLFNVSDLRVSAFQLPKEGCLILVLFLITLEKQLCRMITWTVQVEPIILTGFYNLNQQYTALLWRIFMEVPHCLIVNRELHLFFERNSSKIDMTKYMRSFDVGHERYSACVLSFVL